MNGAARCNRTSTTACATSSRPASRTPTGVCIVGASYGGYAALAAGAFSAELYDCVVAIAPVADLQLMLRQEARDHGRRNWVIDYWEDQYGADASEKDELRAISPAHHADAFTAPVLLIHGKKDTVVNLKQSKTMYRALRKADKDVRLIELKGEDHWADAGNDTY